MGSITDDQGAVVPVQGKRCLENQRRAFWAESCWLMLDDETHLDAALLIKFKPKWLAKCRKGPFGGIGFCGLECNVMHFAWGRAAAFTCAVTFW